MTIHDKEYTGEMRLRFPKTLLSAAAAILVVHNSVVHGWCSILAVVLRCYNSINSIDYIVIKWIELCSFMSSFLPKLLDKEIQSTYNKYIRTKNFFLIYIFLEKNLTVDYKHIGAYNILSASLLINANYDEWVSHYL